MEDGAGEVKASHPCVSTEKAWERQPLGSRPWNLLVPWRNGFQFS